MRTKLRSRNGLSTKSMDWSTISPLRPIKQRLEWLGQRQQVLAGNIANADTSGYVPRDLRPLAFRDAVNREKQVRLAATDARHLAGYARSPGRFDSEQGRRRKSRPPATPSISRSRWRKSTKPLFLTS